jgi:flagellar biogenesis protein FliO
MGSYAGYLLETFVTLLAVCGLAFVVLYGARRLGIGRPRGPIQLVGQLPLDARRAIYLVQVGDQVLVVGASEAGITKLGEIPATQLPAVDPTVAAPFSAVLARVLGTSKTKPAARTAARTATPTATPTKENVE